MMPEPTVCMPADQIAGAITFLSIAIPALAVIVGLDSVLSLIPRKKRRK